MNLILLPGNSVQNRAWIEEVEQVFAPHFDKVYTQYYDHWFVGDGEDLLNIDEELDKLARFAEDFWPYLVFAKSAGVLLVLKGVYSGVLAPDVCTFVGLPIEFAKEYGFDLKEWLLGYSLPSLFIQNSTDPAGSAGQVQELLEEVGAERYELCELEGNTHNYSQVGELWKRVSEFVDLD